MKLWRFLKQHKWSTRIIVLTAIFTAFSMVWLLMSEQDFDSAVHVSESEQQVSVAGSKAAIAKKQREAAEKAAAEAKAREEEATRVKPASNVPVSQTVTGPHRNPASVDVVVNKKNPLVPMSYAPAVTTTSCAGYGSITVSVQAKDDLVALCQAAAEASMPLSASSAYRSYSYQVSVYNRWVAQSGQAQADTFSARPGYSEHQTGFAIDFSVPGGASLNGFTGTPQQKWLAANAVNYGFIQRYTEANTTETGYVAESWHYRYIGRENAKAYAASGALSLESFWGMPGGDY